jgi:thymidylate synthase
MEALYVSPGEAFIGTVNYLTSHSLTVSPRGMRTQEAVNYSLIIAEPWNVPFYVHGRNLNQTIAALEFAQLLGQMSCEAVMRNRVRPVAAFHDFGVSYGNYGSRVRGQLTNIVKTLMEDASSRRAVLSIYSGSSDLRQATKDIPCTLTIQFLIRGGALWMRTSMRSNDAWLGLPYDLMQFCLLQCAIAQCLDIPVGHYCHAVGSMHIYERDLVHDVLGDCDAMDVSGERMFTLITHDPLLRLEEMVSFCQDAIFASAEPRTSFEEWLTEAISA